MGMVATLANALDISTHTLTWSVTGVKQEFVHDAVISTHTLTWSVTLLFVSSHQLCEFQLTRSRGA